MPDLHLVDATYELFRAWFGAPPRRAPDGREVGATRGVAYSLAYMLREEGATHVGCATDHVVRSFRNDLYAGYKTDEGVPEELLAQFALVEDVMRAMGFVVWPMIEFEADDGLATAAHKLGDRAERVLLCTVDKDLAQCVRGERVVMVDRRRKQTLDEAAVKEKFGVTPGSIPDFLALVGDTADGYPGITGFGKKTAATVLAAFGSIEDIPADAALWPRGVRGAAGLAATLRDRRDEALLYKRLATLRHDAPIPESFDELLWRGPRPELTRLTSELGFPDLCDRLPHSPAP
ncbi:MAG: flap endonuclease [Polyangiaceae bacterium]|jgi:5'-3' exonuclease|nr:flap endonuclease [Polyangiaceae bacterium]MBK8942583.1 flap endonuclease [Polyangiaceae bacterium]